MIKIDYLKFPFYLSEILYNDNKDLTLSPSIFKIYNLIQSTEINVPVKYLIYKKTFYTIKINLKKELSEIYDSFDKKSTKYEINCAKKETNNISLKVNCDFSEFANLSRKYYLQKYNISKDISKNLEKYKNFGDLITIYYNNTLISGIFVIKDYPNRIRLLYAYSAYLENPDYKKKSSYLNRYIHWWAIQKYKTEGFMEYDLGGINLDVNSKTYGITKFKLSFGGQICEEYNYLIAKYAKLLKPIYNLKYGDSLE